MGGAPELACATLECAFDELSRDARGRTPPCVDGTMRHPKAGLPPGRLRFARCCERVALPPRRFGLGLSAPFCVTGQRKSAGTPRSTPGAALRQAWLDAGRGPGP